MPSCHLVRFIALQILCLSILRGASTTVVVSNEVAPPGGVVQLKFSLSKPALIAAGELSVDLDPTVFGSITSACAFSANGDAYGFVQIKGLHLDIRFGSPSGGVGQLVGLPVVTLTAVTLSTAAVGKTTSITADPTGSAWTDQYGNAYPAAVGAATVTLGGSLSITSVSPGGGVLASGAVIEVDGTGFANGATAQIDGASVAFVQISRPEKLLITLGGPTELTGKRIRATNPDGSSVDAFPSLPGVPISSSDALNGGIAILPLQTYTAVTFPIGGSFSSGGMAIRNPNPVPVQLLLDTTDAGGFRGERSLTVPAGGSIFDPSKIAGAEGGAILVMASAPVQFLQLADAFAPGLSINVISEAVMSAAAIPPLMVNATVSNGALSWAWQTGSAAPQSQSISLALPRNQPPTNVSVSATTASGGNWLSVTPSGVIACQPGACTSLQVSANPASLSAGIYRGAITITPVTTAFRTVVVPQVIPVTLTVTASPVAQTVIAATYLNPKNLSEPVSIPSGLFSGSFSLSVSTDSGGNWLSAIPNAGSAPSSLLVTTNPAGFGVGSYTGEIVISGSGNTLVVPVYFLVEGSIRLIAIDPGTGGTVDSLNFAAPVGTGLLPSQVVTVSNEDCPSTGCLNANPDLSSLAASVLTHSGGNWLSATVSQGTVAVSANPMGLSAGVYLGAVTLTANGVAPGQSPVVLVVESGIPPALTAGPGLLSFDVMAGLPIQGSAPASLCVTSELVPLAFTVQNSTNGGGGWLHLNIASGTTPACLAVSVDSTTLSPGAYGGNIVISGGQQSVTVPVAVTVTTDGPVQPILLGSIANAASETQGALSPGEIIAIHGQDLGPLNPAGPSINALGQFSTTVSGVSVLIGGVPSPILYASQTEINTVVPYEAAGQSAISIQVKNTNGVTPAWSMPSATSAPGIFTIDGSGLGNGAILNQDSSLNSPSNPAAPGTVIQIFATGEGLTNPAGQTGSVAQSQHLPQLPVTATIGGIPAQVIYAGSAPSEIEGLFQVNAMIPSGIATNDAVPVFLTIGQIQSQTVTIAIRQP